MAVSSATSREWLIRTLIAVSSVCAGAGATAVMVKSDLAEIVTHVAIAEQKVASLEVEVRSHQVQTDERIYRCAAMMEKIIEQNTRLLAEIGAHNGR